MASQTRLLVSVFEQEDLNSYTQFDLSTFCKTLLNLDSYVFLAGHGYNSFKCIDGAGGFYLGFSKVLRLEGHTRG